MLQVNKNNLFLDSTDTDLREIILQMEKELEMAGEKYLFKSTRSDLLILELSSFFKSIDSGNRILNVLYRIDISPKNIDLGQSSYESTASQAWNRVFQKVWFRKQFKTESK